MIIDTTVTLELMAGHAWITRALEDYEFRLDCYRQLRAKELEHGVVAYEKNGIYRVGGSIAHAVALLHDTLLDGTYKYQVAPINARELLR